MAQAVAETPADEGLDYYARVRKHDLDLAADRYKKGFRMRATEFIRGKGSLAVVNDPICMGCTHCFDNCAFEAIDMLDRKFTLPELTYTSRKAVIITENCVGCEKCALVCPVDAITMIPKPGWEVRDGRLVQVEPPPSLEKPFRQPPKPGAPRPPVQAERFVAFREEGKRREREAAKPEPARPPEAPSAPEPSAPEEAAPPEPEKAPPREPPAEAPKETGKPPVLKLTPEEVRRLREEARKRAEAAKAGG